MRLLRHPHVLALCPPPLPPCEWCRRRPHHFFLAQSVIFDDLCTNFQHHEELDASNALVTVTKTQEGKITGASLDISSEAVGVVPITVPTSGVDMVRTLFGQTGRMESDRARIPVPSRQPEAPRTNHLSSRPRTRACAWLCSTQVSLNGLTVYDTETYGSDTTYYVASSQDAVPEALPKLTEG